MSKQDRLRKIAGSVVSEGLKAVDKVVDFPKVDEVTRALRIRICEGNVCGEFDPVGRQCNACGCKMDLKVTLVKSPFTGEVIGCPEGLW